MKKTINIYIPIKMNSYISAMIACTITNTRGQGNAMCVMTRNRASAWQTETKTNFAGIIHCRKYHIYDLCANERPKDVVIITRKLPQ